METISLIDGLILTVVSMLLVFIVLGTIGFLIDVVAKFVGESEVVTTPVPVKQTVSTNPLQENQENKFVAEMMALVLASEDEPNRKFEVVETKRIN